MKDKQISPGRKPQYSFIPIYMLAIAISNKTQVAVEKTKKAEGMLSGP